MCLTTLVHHLQAKFSQRAVRLTCYWFMNEWCIPGPWTMAKTRTHEQICMIGSWPIPGRMNNLHAWIMTKIRTHAWQQEHAKPVEPLVEVHTVVEPNLIEVSWLQWNSDIGFTILLLCVSLLSQAISRKATPASSEDLKQHLKFNETQSTNRNTHPGRHTVDRWSEWGVW